jgi:hypothetical protein
LRNIFAQGELTVNDVWNDGDFLIVGTEEDLPFMQTVTLSMDYDFVLVYFSGVLNFGQNSLEQISVCCVLLSTLNTDTMSIKIVDIKI